MPYVQMTGPAGNKYEAPVHRATITTRMLQGAGLGALMTLFRVSSGLLGPRRMPLWEWSALLGAVTVGGAVGGAAYYASDIWRLRGGWRKTTANVGSLLAYAAAVLVALLVLGRFIPELWR